MPPNLHKAELVPTEFTVFAQEITGRRPSFQSLRPRPQHGNAIGKALVTQKRQRQEIDGGANGDLKEHGGKVIPGEADWDDRGAHQKHSQQFFP